MKYDFDEPTNRRHTNSVKWDSRADVDDNIIPLWVADMDFKAAPAILEALRRRVDVGIFGYTYVPDSYYEAITYWFDKYHNWHINPNQVIYTSGVVPAISAIIKALAKPNGKVIVQTPVYNCFFTCIVNNKCQVLRNPLLLKDGRYEMDFEDLEHKAADPDCNLMLLCNPHNPAGRVWTPNELKRVHDICRRNGVLVISDEIHCELVFDGFQYTPYANIASAETGSEWVSCVSPTKAFNIAGLQIANIVSSNDSLKAKIDRAINDNEVCDVNPFGVDALIAAYRESRGWLEALLPYLWNNYLLLRSEFEKEIPECPVIKLEGTYLAWIDCRKLGLSTHALEEALIKEVGVWVNAGIIYGQEGEGFIRINLATQRARLEEGLRRLIPALKKRVSYGEE